MTKSVISAMVGVLVCQQKLTIDGPAPVAAWSDPRDPRRTITIDNLLRMTSGLDVGQSLTAGWTSVFNPSSQMEFDMPDMAAFAARERLAAPSGSIWKYTNGNTLLRSRIIRDRVRGDPGFVIRLARRELFDRLGMTHVILEFDGAGTPIGSSHMWASARDWVCFGLLYATDGVVGGECVPPCGWANYSARLTPGSEDYGYGAGFWTNRGTASAIEAGIRAGMPGDSFMARAASGNISW